MKGISGTPRQEGPKIAPACQAERKGLQVGADQKARPLGDEVESTPDAREWLKEKRSGKGRGVESVIMPHKTRQTEKHGSLREKYIQERTEK